MVSSLAWVVGVAQFDSSCLGRLKRPGTALATERVHLGLKSPHRHEPPTVSGRAVVLAQVGVNALLRDRSRRDDEPFEDQPVGP